MPQVYLNTECLSAKQPMKCYLNPPDELFQLHLLANQVKAHAHHVLQLSLDPALDHRDEAVVTPVCSSQNHLAQQLL